MERNVNDSFDDIREGDVEEEQVGDALHSLVGQDDVAHSGVTDNGDDGHEGVHGHEPDLQGVGGHYAVLP